MIYTTYFERVQDLPENITPVSISNKAPEGWDKLEYKKLASNNTISYKKEVLDILHADEVAFELYTIVPTEHIALVCDENPDGYCYRHMVSAWFNENGFDSEEYQYE